VEAPATDALFLDNLKTFRESGTNEPWPEGRAVQERDFEIHRAIFDAVPASGAVIDNLGRLLAFNESWRRDAGVNPMVEDKLEIGGNYLEACGRVGGGSAGDAAAIVQGLRGVLEGAQEEFIHEYRCQCRGERRWYRLRAAPFVSRQHVGAMLLYTDITKRGAAVENLRLTESKYRSMFENATEGIYQTSPDGQYLAVNPMLAKIYGYDSCEELAGAVRNIAQQLYVYPRRRDEFIKVMAEKGIVYQFESAIYRKDGNIIWISENARAVRDAAGSLLYYEGTVVDITELKHAEEQIRSQAALLDKAHDAIMVQDLQNQIQYWNKSAERIYGWSSAEAVGKEAGPLLYLDAPAFDRALAVALAEGGWFGEMKHRRKDGSEVIVESTLTLVCDAEGQPKSILAINTDVTEKKRLEKQVIHAQRMDSIGTLAGGIAHDFNNILTIIAGFAQLGRSSALPEHPVQRSLSAIEKAAQRAAGVVRQILTFSRRQETERRVLDLPPVVREALGFLHTTLPANVEIHCQYQPMLPPILADATQIHQIIMNLGTNAAHAMRGHGGRLDVSLDAVVLDAAQAGKAANLRAGRYVHIVISDTGTGMDAPTLQHIFEPFFTTKSRGEGSGLGLAVVHGIVKNHDGAITVSSEPGQGTVFQLYFPALEVESPSANAREATEYSGQGRRLLYVDDEQDIVMLMEQDLEARGYVVDGYHRPDAALEAFRANPWRFDAAVVDMSMPRLDGFDLSRQLLAIRPEFPIVMISGFIQAEDPEKARAAGIRKLLDKPCPLAKLGLALDEACGQARRS
jgi:PAS domain S-box-containing protein